jgi:hypothetical protein
MANFIVEIVNHIHKTIDQILYELSEMPEKEDIVKRER